MTSTAGTFDPRRRLQLILQQVDQLPTLSSVAVRLLEVTSSDESSASDVVRLVASDPSLSAKVLKLCRAASRGVAVKDLTIERAVVLLGFDEVRSAALAVEVFELLDGVASRGGETRSADGAFDRLAFWQHCLAVGIACEALVRGSSYRESIDPGEAFLAGLLHDLGQLALHAVLPRSFDTCCELADQHGLDIDQACRRVIGIDSHTVGKHLADHWQLPERMVESIWLNSRPFDAVPASEHRDLVRLVTLADLIARRLLLAHAGHGPQVEDLASVAGSIGLEPRLVERVSDTLHEQVSERAVLIGLGETTSRDLLRATIERANTMLSRVRQSAQRHSVAGQIRTRALRACQVLFDGAMPGASLTTTVEAVARSASSVFGDGMSVVVHLPGGAGPAPAAPSGAPAGRAEIFCFSNQAALERTVAVDVESPIAWGEPTHGPLNVVAPWLDTLALPPEIARGHGLRLACSADVSAMLLREKDFGGTVDAPSLEVLRHAWGAAIAAAALAERASAASERLVEAHRELVAAQETIAQHKAMKAVGEMAAGAAHEMNNPLTVISGRAQLMQQESLDPRVRSGADEIVRASHRLSDLITSLRLYAEPPQPKPQTVSLVDLVNDVMRDLRARLKPAPGVRVSIDDGIPPVRIDRVQLGAALRELIQNAHEARPGTGIEVRVQIDPLDDRLMIQVIDSGPGLSQTALVHAFDPFFSEKPSGRQPGLGLARARRLVEINGGSLTLKNGAHGGAVATIALSGWRGRNAAYREAA